MEFTRLIADQIFPVLLIFARVGTALMIMPGFGETFVPARVRLLIAVAIAFVMSGPLGPTLPSQPAGVSELGLLIGGEVLVGAFIGTIARIMVSTMDTAGTIISTQTGLSSAQLFNPGFQTTGSIVGVMLTLLAVVLIFATNLHHLLLMAVYDSYSLFRPGQQLATGDMAELMGRVLSSSFLIALQLSAPFVILGLLFAIALGVMAKLMPQVQVFFVSMPIQLLGGIAIIGVVLSAAMLWFLRYFEDGMHAYLLPR